MTALHKQLYKPRFCHHASYICVRHGILRVGIAPRKKKKRRIQRLFLFRVLAGTTLQRDEPRREVVPSPSPQHPHTMPTRTSVTHVGAPECVQTFFANPLKTGSSSCQASASAVSLAFEVRRDCSDASLWVRVYRRLSGVSRERLLACGF